MWSNDRPTTSGFYWCHQHGKTRIVDIWCYKNGTELFTNEDGGASIKDTLYDGTQWMAAVIPPNPQDQNESAQPAPIVPDATVLLRRAAMAMEVVGTDWRESDPTLRLDLASALAAAAEMDRQEPPREWWDCLIADISAVGCVHRGSPTYVHDAYWMRDRAVQILEKRRDSIPGAKGE